MKNKIISVIISVMLVSTITLVPSFAVSENMGTDNEAQSTETTDLENMDVKETANFVEDMINDKDICGDVIKEKDAFQIGEDEDIKLPVSGDDNIVTAATDSEGNDVDIKMGLPVEVNVKDGILTKEGTVIYEGAKNDVGVNVAVQGLEEDGISVGTRAMVTIENAEAPKEYSYEFELPEGYSLIKGSEYDKMEEETPDGMVYVLDANGEVVEAIEPAWAKDANGNDVETYYEINANTLTQIVNFDENTAFPVIADPTAHHGE